MGMWGWTCRVWTGSYLNGYVPNLQVGGQIVRFLAHRGQPIPSPAAVGRIGDRFRASVISYAQANKIAVVRFAKGARKQEVMERFVAAQAGTGRSGVAAIGVAQEFQWVASCSTKPARSAGGVPHFQWGRAQRRVTVFTSTCGMNSSPGTPAHPDPGRACNQRPADRS